MFSVLANRTYRHLLLAQVIALLGTGLATVALGLLAYDIAGGEAGAVLGTALAIKMIAYIGVAPVVGAYANRLPRRSFLVAMDLLRAGVALSLPFVTEVWQIYILIFVLQTTSAAFTPTFQATIPDVLPDERDYTKALSLSRLAYDMESLISPILAAGLLTLINFHWLFSGTMIGFIASALLVVTTVLPRAPKQQTAGQGVYSKTTRGVRFYLRTPRLRGLLALTLASAAASSMVIVNTVVIVRDKLGLGQQEVALTLAAFGAGSILAAFTLPRILDRVSDRVIMLMSGAMLAWLLAIMAVVTYWIGGHSSYWYALLAGWFAMGIAYSMSVTPSGRLLKRSAKAEDRPALFAAQFALSHGCWLICYPLAGQLGAGGDQILAFVVLSVLAHAGVIGARFLWPAEDPDILAHSHPDLPPEHPHMREDHRTSDGHVFVVDDLHPRWPQ